jgi:hypothetical protein
VQEYLNSWSTLKSDVAKAAPIPFNVNGLQSGGVFHDPSVGNNLIFVVLKPGTYKVTFLVLAMGNPGPVGLGINNKVSIENIYEIKAGNQQIQGFLIEDFALGDNFGIYHVNDTNTLMLGEPINASIIVELLG